MANWVKFSDRLPTEDDLDAFGGLVVSDDEGNRDYVYWYRFQPEFPMKACYWLENIPPVPKPRTLEDVVREYVYHAGNTIRRLELQDEMKEILEKKT